MHMQPLHYTELAGSRHAVLPLSPFPPPTRAPWCLSASKQAYWQQLTCNVLCFRSSEIDALLLQPCRLGIQAGGPLIQLLFLLRNVCLLLQ